MVAVSLTCLGPTSASGRQGQQPPRYRNKEDNKQLRPPQKTKSKEHFVEVLKLTRPLFFIDYYNSRIKAAPQLRNVTLGLTTVAMGLLHHLTGE